MADWKRVLLWLGLGLIAGLGAGLYLGWVAWPTEFTNTDPSILRPDYKRDYLVMTAQAYSLDGDLTAARRRLVSLGEPEPDRWLLQTTVDAILTGRDEASEIRPLVQLAHALGLSSPAMVPYLTGGSPGGTEADVP